jgi:hypothetical protein
MAAAQALQEPLQLGRRGDVELTVDDERPVAAQVGDLRDLPAGRAWGARRGES